MVLDPPITSPTAIAVLATARRTLVGLLSCEAVLVLLGAVLGPIALSDPAPTSNENQFVPGGTEDVAALLILCAVSLAAIAFTLGGLVVPYARVVRRLRPLVIVSALAVGLGNVTVFGLLGGTAGPAGSMILGAAIIVVFSAGCWRIFRPRTHEL